MKNVSGQALNNGIMMVADNIVVIVKDKDGKMKKKIIKVNYKSIKQMNAPIIRGIFQITIQLKNSFQAMIFSYKNSANKFNLWLVISFFIIYYAYPYVINLNKKLINDSHIDLLFIVIVILFLIFSKSFKNRLKYHGAEHKTVNCYENYDDLTLINVKKYPKEHVRCGTSFITLIIFFAILVEIIISFIPTKYEFIGYLILLPIFIGISYEFMIITFRKNNKKYAKIILKIGLFLQNITTKEPDDDQIELAIEALKLAIENFND